MLLCMCFESFNKNSGLSAPVAHALKKGTKAVTGAVSFQNEQKFTQFVRC